MLELSYPCACIYVCMSYLLFALLPSLCSFFFFNDTATTEIYTLSLHDALPISRPSWRRCRTTATRPCSPSATTRLRAARSEEHTSELQSLTNLVCRLLLEKKNKEGSAVTHFNRDEIGSRTNSTRSMITRNRALR